MPPTDWAVPSPVLRYSIAADVKRSGSRSSCVQVVSGFSQCAQYTLVRHNSYYSLSAWARLKLPAAGPVSVSIALQAAYEPWATFGAASTVINATTEWVQLSLPRTPKPAVRQPGVNNSEVLVLLVVNTPGANVCWDDVALAEAGAWAQRRGLIV